MGGTGRQRSAVPVLTGGGHSRRVQGATPPKSKLEAGSVGGPREMIVELAAQQLEHKQTSIDGGCKTCSPSRSLPSARSRAQRLSASTTL